MNDRDIEILTFRKKYPSQEVGNGPYALREPAERISFSL